MESPLHLMGFDIVLILISLIFYKSPKEHKEVPIFVSGNTITRNAMGSRSSKP